MSKNTNKAPLKNKNIVRKPEKTDVPREAVVVEDEIPALPDTQPKKLAKPKLGIRARVVKRSGLLGKRALQIAHRIGLDEDDIKALQAALKVMEDHANALPADWKPAAGGGSSAGPRTSLEKGSKVALKPKFFPVFVDEDTTEEDLANLTITKVFAEGKKVVASTPNGDKLILNAQQVRAV